MTKQVKLALAYDTRDIIAREGNDLRLTAVEVAHRAEKQGLVLAAQVGVDPGQFSRALYGRGNHFDLAWLPALLHADSERLLLSKAAGFVGCEVQPRRELTVEEKLDRLQRECRHSGAAGEAILQRALGEDA